MTGTDTRLPTVPYTLTRVGVVMTPEEGNPNEVEGVLNPASGVGPDGRFYLLPRMVAAGNVSRVGLARIVVEDGIPVGVERQGVVLEPDRSWERGVGNAGVEDPRVTWIERLGLHVMTYVAYGPLGPRTALAVSTDLRDWRRLGPVLFAYDDALDIDLNLFHNKDIVFFPEPVIAPDGVESFAVIHRPMWDLGETKPGQGIVVPAGVTDKRQSIWISYVPVAAVRGRPVGAHVLASAPFRRRTGVRVRRAQDRRRTRAAAGARRLAAAAPRGDRRDRRRVLAAAERPLRRGRDPAGRRRPVAGHRADPRAAPAGRDGGRAQRHRAERGLPDRDRADRRACTTSSTAWPTRRSAWHGSTGCEPSARCSCVRSPRALQITRCIRARRVTSAAAGDLARRRGQYDARPDSSGAVMNRAARASEPRASSATSAPTSTKDAPAAM